MHLPVHEWLATNGLGGFASGTVQGPPARRYHGLRVAALPTPIGRALILGPMREEIILADGGTRRLEGPAPSDHPTSPKASQSAEFRLEMGLPVWTFRIGDAVLEKRLLMAHQLNTVLVIY